MRRLQTDRRTIDLLKIYFSKIQIADKDDDLDREIYTSTSWDGDSFSNGNSGVIDWVADFGLPEIPKMVWLRIMVRDSASAGGWYLLRLKAKGATTNWSIYAEAEAAVNDQWRSTHGCVAVADNGTTFYAVVASGTNTMDVYINVVAWVK